MANRTPESLASGQGDAGADVQARQQAGALLREAREAAQRSVAELATQLKVASEKIVALESGDWSRLHGDAHARGLLRAAARAVHADPEAVLQPLPPAFVAGAPMFPGRGASLLPGRAPTPVGTHSGGTRLVWVALVLLLLALALLYLPRSASISHWLQRLRAREHGGPAPAHLLAPAHHALAGSGASAAALPKRAGAFAPAAAAAGVGVARDAAPIPAASGAEAALPARPGRGAASAPSAVAGRVPRPMAAASAATTVTTAAAGPGVDVGADAPSWVQLRSAGGKVLFSGLLAAGASQQVPTRMQDFPLQVVVGNAAHTSLRLGGASVPLVPDHGGVARLQLRAGPP